MSAQDAIDWSAIRADFPLLQRQVHGKPLVVREWNVCWPNKHRAAATVEPEALSEKDLARELRRREKLMLEHARNLEFEQAARVRDQLAQLKQRVLGAAGEGSAAA